MSKYEQVTKDGAAATKGLMTIWEKLGRPTDTSVSTGWILLDNIIQIWMKYFPHELAEYKKSMQESLGAERTPWEAGDGGHFLTSYPTSLFNLIKTLLPDQRLNDKKFIETMTRRYPIFKATNY